MTPKRKGDRMNTPAPTWIVEEHNNRTGEFVRAWRQDWGDSIFIIEGPWHGDVLEGVGLCRPHPSVCCPGDGSNANVDEIERLHGILREVHRICISGIYEDGYLPGHLVMRIRELAEPFVEET